MPDHSAASSHPGKFTGSDNYVATDDLKLAVNAALTLQATYRRWKKVTKHARGTICNVQPAT